ncbi:MAG: glycerol-3-phosphate O-acyltransferase, partial [Myxococcota bacterium]
QGALVLDPKGVENADATDVVRSALRHFGTYHTHPVMKRRGDRVFTEDMKLLLYYSNRMRGYGLESKLADAGEHQA